MKDLREFTRNSLIYLGSRVAGGALPLLLLPFLVRELGPDEYGKIGLFTASFSILMVVIGLGTHGFVRLCYNRSSQKEMRLILGNATLLIAAMTFACLLILLALGQYFDVLRDTYAPYLYLGAVAAIGQKVIELKLALWQMGGKAVKFGFLTFVATAINIAASVFLVFVVGMQSEGRIFGMLLPTAIIGPILLSSMYRGGYIHFKVDREVLKRILAFGVPLVPHSIALASIIFVERLALSNNPDGSSLGIFFAAFQLAMPIGIIVNSANLQFRAWSDKKMEDGDHHAVVKASYALMAVYLIVGGAYYWVLGFVYPLIVGDAFAEGYPIMGILILAATFRGFYLVVVKGLFFAEGTRLLMSISVFLFVVFSIILLNFDDLYTVAYLDLAFNVLLFLFVWIASAKICPQPWLSFYRTKSS